MVLNDIRLESVEITQALLNIDDKNRSNLLAWKGQFSPQLIDVLIEHYAGEADTILDPFMGSGTVLCEGLARGHHVIGADVNPAAFILARTYTIANTPLQERFGALEELGSDLDSVLLSNSSLPSTTNAALNFEAALCEVVGKRGGIAHILAEALVVLSDFYRTDFDAQRVMKTWRRLQEIVKTIPYSSLPVEAYHGDSRALPLEAGQVDLTITSPPYINVFNYHQQYRKSAEALGWDLLQVAKSEVGSNRKHRGNRFLTAIQYCIDIAQTLQEIQRVSKPNAKTIFVVGRESTIRGVKLFNGDIVARIALECFGSLPLFRQERSFRNRFGQNIVEDILHIEGMCPCRPSALETAARKVALDVLIDAEASASPDVVTDIRQAIEGAGKVKASPLLFCEPARKVNKIHSAMKKEDYAVSYASS